MILENGSGIEQSVRLQRQNLGTGRKNLGAPWMHSPARHRLKLNVHIVEPILAAKATRPLQPFPEQGATNPWQNRDHQSPSA